MNVRIGATLLLLAATHAVAQDAVNVTVRVATPVPATGVELQREHDFQILPLPPTGVSFSTEVPRPTTNAGSGKLVEPYRLVASWPDGREQLFLGIAATGPDKLDLIVFHTAGSTDRTELNRIDQLGTDFVSTLERYFRARAFHKDWRFQKRLPEHEVAIRSARIWFDASASLATSASSFFRIDSEIEAIMRGYEALAASDRGFAARYRRYAPPGYVVGMLAQAVAAPYRQVAAVPDLVRRGDLEAAQTVNSSALSSLTAAPQDIRAIIARNQGVTIGLLEGNAAFIQTRRGAM